MDDNFRDQTGRFLEGNPGGAGRPKGSLSITNLIRKALEEMPDGDKKTNAEKLVEIIITKAIKDKDDATISKIWSYIDGLPKGVVGLEFDKENMESLTKFFKALANPNDGSRPDSPGDSTKAV